MFIRRVRSQLGLDARPAADPVEAARGAGVVLLATSSAVPVLRGSDVRPGAFVATLGPKQVDRAEFGPDLARDAQLIVSDSPAQVIAYEPPHILAGTVDGSRVQHLGAVLDHQVEVPEDGTRLFLSVGLAGTEAWLLNRLTDPIPPTI